MSEHLVPNVDEMSLGLMLEIRGLAQQEELSTTEVQRIWQEGQELRFNRGEINDQVAVSGRNFYHVFKHHFYYGETAEVRPGEVAITEYLDSSSISDHAGLICRDIVEEAARVALGRLAYEGDGTLATNEYGTPERRSEVRIAEPMITALIKTAAEHELEDLLDIVLESEDITVYTVFAETLGIKVSQAYNNNTTGGAPETVECLKTLVGEIQAVPHTVLGQYKRNALAKKIIDDTIWSDIEPEADPATISLS